MLHFTWCLVFGSSIDDCFSFKFNNHKSISWPFFRNKIITTSWMPIPANRLQLLCGFPHLSGALVQIYAKHVLWWDHQLTDKKCQGHQIDLLLCFIILKIVDSSLIMTVIFHVSVHAWVPTMHITFNWCLTFVKKAKSLKLVFDLLSLLHKLFLALCMSAWMNVNIYCRIQWKFCELILQHCKCDENLGCMCQLVWLPGNKKIFTWYHLSHVWRKVQGWNVLSSIPLLCLIRK